MPMFEAVPPATWIWLLPSLLLFFLDKGYRMLKPYINTTKLVEVVLHPSSVVELQFATKYEVRIDAHTWPNESFRHCFTSIYDKIWGKNQSPNQTTKLIEVVLHLSSVAVVFLIPYIKKNLQWIYIPKRNSMWNNQLSIWCINSNCIWSVKKNLQHFHLFVNGALGLNFTEWMK